MNVADIRRLAFALSGTEEKDHHGRPSFRVGGKIYATIPDGDHLNVMLGEDAVEMATSVAPSCCEKLWWGKKLSGVRVTLTSAESDFVADLLHEAWSRRAPGPRRC